MTTIRTATQVGEVRISFEHPTETAQMELPTSRRSCWCRVLGPIELPDDDALELLAAAAEQWPQAPQKIRITGAPAAALLPVLWLRTIWLEADARIELLWERIDPPGDDPREQFAAHLCTRFVNRVTCADPARAASLWGIEPGESAFSGPELFDDMIGLIDGWDIMNRSVGRQQPMEWMMRARAALERCADTGRKRIALYGAGTHTREIGPLLMEPRVEILCIIDDYAAGQGRRLWGFPIVSKERAIALGVEAVILSANSIEDKLWAGSQVLRDAGIEVIRLYADDSAAPRPAHAQMITRQSALRGEERGAPLVFPAIHAHNSWGDGESRSGPGSSLAQTRAIRAALPTLIKRLEIRSLLDAPCGDFNWMKEVAPMFERYAGVDIVPEIVTANRARYATDSITFLRRNIITDDLPTADAVLCRDCLVHLSFADAHAAIANLRRAGARYLFATTFPRLPQGNIDIETGGWRPLDLCQSPFSFPAPIAVIDEKCPDHALKALAVWRMADVVTQS